MEEKNETTIAMQFMLKLNEFQNEIIKSMNYMRGDIHELNSATSCTILTERNCNGRNDRQGIQ